MAKKRRAKPGTPAPKTRGGAAGPAVPAPDRPAQRQQARREPGDDASAKEQAQRRLEALRQARQMRQQ